MTEQIAWPEKWSYPGFGIDLCFAYQCNPLPQDFMAKNKHNLSLMILQAEQIVLLFHVVSTGV